MTNPIAAWRESPARMVRDLFDVEPDAWQEEVLEAFPHNQRIAMKACKGPGKTCLLAWLCWNFLLTRPHPKIAATSITGDNLSDNLWSEMAKWMHKSAVLKATFVWTKTRIFSREYPETWWMSARTWPRSADSRQQSETLAGLHADYIMFILDESSGIPQAVMATAEAALASGIESKLVQAGNPTQLDGPLYSACVTHRQLWHVVEITSDPDDPNRTPRVSIEWARQQIEMYGEDNPWVLVNVFGRFPPQSINALLSMDDIELALARTYHEGHISGAARILGIDVARDGDDKSVIFPRQGVLAYQPTAFRNIDGIQGAGHVAQKHDRWNADAMFLDGTGGWATSWHDQLKVLGYNPVSVPFSGKASDLTFFNKRTEMLFSMATWVKEGGSLPPDCREIIGELMALKYFFKGDRMAVVEKDQIKEEIGRSPDYSDALALTFAYPVSPKGKLGQNRVRVVQRDPLEEWA